ncbi:MAG: alanine dehydrogenase [Bacteroidota bacterium]
MFTRIGLAKEVESPENPGSLERRVALIPSDVQRLTDAGCQVFVEDGAGEGVGFSNEAYEQAGAVLQAHSDLYRDKDLVVKFKGPAMDSIPEMNAGTALFCMAHFHSFPKRAALLEKHRITVIAMENIVQSPERLDDDLLLGFMAADYASEPWIRRGGIDQLNVHVQGYSDVLAGFIRRVMDHRPQSLTVYPNSIPPNQVSANHHSLLAFDGLEVPEALHNDGTYSTDVRSFSNRYGSQALDYYRLVNPPFPLGKRKIESLHETGQAGARYGIQLLQETSPLQKKPEEQTVVVLGYGNVGMGAIHECTLQGVRRIHILGKAHTGPEAILPYLEQADLVINGAEQPVHLRGKNFLVTADHTRQVLKKGAVVIDLVGGSATNRSAVEPVIECTYLTDPYFEQDGIFFSALWGWPMMGFMRETAIKYSGQIADILLGEDRLIDGVSDIPNSIKPAIVCGPFAHE